MRDGEKVEDDVGGAAEDDGERDRVLDGAAGEDVARLNVALEEFAHGGADGGALLGLLGGGGRVGGGAGEGHAHGFGGASHGVCGVHLKGS